MVNERLKPYAYVAAGTVLQGLSPVLTKLLLDALSPAVVVGARYLIATLILLPFGWRPPAAAAPELKPRRRDWVALFLIGALGSGLASLMFTHAIYLTSVGVATALSKTAPIFVAFFAYFTLRERITSARLLLVLLMVAADLLIGAGEMSAGSPAKERLLGDALALGAGALRAMAEVLGKASLRRFYPSTVALWRFGIGFLVTGLVAVAQGQWAALAQLTPAQWGLLGVLGVLCTSLSMTLYYRGLKDIPAHVGVSLRLLSAIVTVLLSWLILGEALNLLHLSGIAVLVTGAYLIVVRTTRQPLLGAALQAVRETDSWRPLQTLRGRVALLVAVMISLTVLGATLLSVQHNRAVLNEQVRLMMVKTATVILQLQGVAEPPSAETYRQYLDRVLQHRIVGRNFSLEIVYLLVLDSQGNLIAWAKADDLPVSDETGALLPRGASATGRLLQAQVQSGQLARERDLMPLAAELTREGRVLGVVKMGTRRSVAHRAATEIALRNITLAVLLIIFGVAVSYYLVGHLARPLEQLSALAWRVSHGELDVPLVPLGGRELESLSRSMARMAEELRTAQVLQGVLARQVCGGQGGAEPLQGAVLWARLPEQTPLTADDLRDLIATVAQNEGRLAAFAPGAVLAVWGEEGGEQDDLLRAVVAAIEWRAQCGSRRGRDLSGAGVIIAMLEEQAPTAEVVSDLAGRWEQGGAGGEFPVLLTAEASAAVDEHLAVEALPGTDLHRLAEEELGFSGGDLAEGEAL